jgi:hypothetical protein
MTVRKTLVIMMIVLGGLMWGTSIAAARPRRKTPFECPPKNEGVVAADATAVVYKALEVPDIFACANSAKRAYYLGRESYGGRFGSVETGPVALAAAVVAYHIGESPLTGPSIDEIRVRNLRTGKLLRRLSSGSPLTSGNSGLGNTMAIVVKSDGSVAWTTYWLETGPLRVKQCPPECAPGGPQYEWEKVYTAVHVSDKLGSRLIASGENVEPHSLALTGSTLYWTQGGKPMSAVLK